MHVGPGDMDRKWIKGGKKAQENDKIMIIPYLTVECLCNEELGQADVNHMSTMVPVLAMYRECMQLPKPTIKVNHYS